MFLKDVHLDLKPEYFACSSQSDKNNFRDFNTGVMLMNTKFLEKSHKNFSNFIKNNLKIFSAFDQTAYQIFYNGKNTKLPLIYNHKPYWGIDEKAVILHFHGAKPTTFTAEESFKYMSFAYANLYKQNPDAYDFYLELFKKNYPDINYLQNEIEKLKAGEYPTNKPGKNPLLLRVKNKLIKQYKTVIQNFFGIINSWTNFI